MLYLTIRTAGTLAVSGKNDVLPCSRTVSLDFSLKYNSDKIDYHCISRYILLQLTYEYTYIYIYGYVFSLTIFFLYVYVFERTFYYWTLALWCRKKKFQIHKATNEFFLKYHRYYIIQKKYIWNIWYILIQLQLINTAYKKINKISNLSSYFEKKKSCR